jgi:hypothetical protein
MGTCLKTSVTWWGKKPDAVSVLRQAKDNGRTFVKASIQNIVTVHLFDHLRRLLCFLRLLSLLTTLTGTGNK